MRTATVKKIVQAAFGLEEYQVSGGPQWIDSTRYEIGAQADNSTLQNQLLSMLQSVLVERFHLAARSETKMVAGMAMVLEKGRTLRPLLSEAN
jgi:uncharacterized protein (TIGR03435 family)